MKELTVFILFRVVLHTLIKHMMTAGIGHGSLNIIVIVFNIQFDEMNILGKSSHLRMKIKIVITL